MTKRELIEQMEPFDDEAVVFGEDGDGRFEITAVKADSQPLPKKEGVNYSLRSQTVMNIMLG